ncbi:MAG: response regulator, partial [Bacteroidota bacterium]
RELMEDRIRQAQKLESIGTLAGGIAHDFNNILGIILGHLSIVRQPMCDEDMRTSSAETITNAVNRGANLVRQILTFARKSDARLLPVNVNESIKEIHKMLEETFPKSIEFVIDLEKVLPFIIIDAGQLHQALLNLCINARDAVVEAHKGAEAESRITLKTAVVKGKELRVHFPEVSAEQYVAISVTDTGTGMDEATRDRIFEPFFTTKEKGKGTGLGLAVVYGVVKSARGILDVQSTLGIGSVFTLYLPVPKETNVLEARPETSQAEIRGGTETVFIVEDEETMLVVIKMSLQNKGYTIISAADGREALERFKEHMDHIDLVITDLGLPKMSGENVVREMKRLKPDIKIIVASGFVDPNQRSELFKLGAKDVIMKPYEQTEVLEKVRSVLDEE